MKRPKRRKESKIVEWIRNSMVMAIVMSTFGISSACVLPMIHPAFLIWTAIFVGYIIWIGRDESGTR